MRKINLLIISFLIITLSIFGCSKETFNKFQSEISKDEAKNIVYEYVKLNNNIQEEIIIDSIDDIELNGKKAYGFNPRVIMDMHTSSLGFFYVTVDGNLYEMDILNPNNLIKIK
ncbi:hypothetical protein [Clostridium sp.]|uniref:hypothetical protein n=1 Tax=Clostridium sp. TaxID=1506 RepID=UPI0026DA7FA5|nr:hypothetical protein [Clostridium sp.]MDO5038429.1 hypothetical protein [Clostridium sp.]